MAFKFRDIGEPHSRRRANVAKRINLIALSLLFLMLVVLFILFLQLKQNNRELEMQKRQIETMAEELSSLREKEWQDAWETHDSLNTIREVLQTGEIEKVNQYLQGESEMPAPQPPMDVDRLPDVVVYQTERQIGEAKQFEKEIGNLGYPVIIHDYRDFSWLEDLPTIFYFDESNADDVKVIQEVLEKFAPGVYRVIKAEQKTNVKLKSNRRIEVHMGKPGAPLPDLTDD